MGPGSGSILSPALLLNPLRAMPPLLPVPGEVTPTPLRGTRPKALRYSDGEKPHAEIVLKPTSPVWLTRISFKKRGKNKARLLPPECIYNRLQARLQPGQRMRLPRLADAGTSPAAQSRLDCIWNNITHPHLPVFRAAGSTFRAAPRDVDIAAVDLGAGGERITGSSCLRPPGPRQGCVYTHTASNVARSRQTRALVHQKASQRAPWNVQALTSARGATV